MTTEQDIIKCGRAKSKERKKASLIMKHIAETQSSSDSIEKTKQQISDIINQYTSEQPDLKALVMKELFVQQRKGHKIKLPGDDGVISIRPAVRAHFLGKINNDPELKKGVVKAFVESGESTYADLSPPKIKSEVIGGEEVSELLSSLRVAADKKSMFKARGHRLGADHREGKFDFSNNKGSGTTGADGTREESEELAFDTDALNWFKSDLESYRDKSIGTNQEKLFEHLAGPMIESASNTLKALDDSLRNNEGSYDVEINELMNLINSGMPAMIPAGWAGHSINIIVWGNQLVVSNRGQGKNPDGGTTVINLSRPLTKDDVKLFFESTRNGQNQMGSVQRKIAELGNGSDSLYSRVFSYMPIRLQNFLSNFSLTNPTSRMKNQVAVIPHKAQKYGTCSFVNKKSSVEGLMLLSSLRGDRPLSDKITVKESDITEEHKKSARKDYKDFTIHIRDQEVKRTIEIANGPDPESEEQKYAVERLATYVNKHHKVKKQDGAEIKRCIEIVDEVPGVKDKIDPKVNEIIDSARRDIEAERTDVEASSENNRLFSEYEREHTIDENSLDHGDKTHQLQSSEMIKKAPTTMEMASEREAADLSSVRSSPSPDKVENSASKLK